MSVSLSTIALKALQGRFGEHISCASAVLDTHSKDENHGRRYRPDAVVFAHNEKDVVDILALAREHKFPITPFAAGSSLEGQILPVNGGISLDLMGLNHIQAIEPSSFQATVQAGVTYPELNKKARQHGIFFPVDPGAEASLGGMAATNASGTGAVKYGTTRDNILEMRVALLDGRIIRVGSKARKTSAGYSLKDLFIGSEGTLGIITELTVKMWPLPENIVVLRCHFETIEDATSCAVNIMGAALQPERLELIDSEQIRAVNAYKNSSYPEKPTLWIELASSSATALEENIAFCSEICEDSGSHGLSIARDITERAAIWEARHHTHYALTALYPNDARLSTDLCVPLKYLPDIITFTEKICQEENIHTSFVGHVGDGNFHALFHAPIENKETWQKIYSTYDKMVEKALEVGGTCTGEHGIGLNKRKYLQKEHGESLDLMRKIKNIFDPMDLLNPSKILTHQIHED